MARREPERVVDRAAHAALGRLRERGRLGGFFPGAAEVGGAEHGGAQVAGLGGCQQRAAVARVEPHMAHDVAQEVRAVDAPGLALGVAVKEPRAFAGGHHHDDPAWRLRA